MSSAQSISGHRKLCSLGVGNGYYYLEKQNKTGKCATTRRHLTGALWGKCQHEAYLMHMETEAQRGEGRGQGVWASKRGSDHSSAP